MAVLALAGWPAGRNWSVSGPGCAGAVGVPALAPQSGALPVLGSNWTLRLTYGTGTGLGVLAVGVSNQTWTGGTLPQPLGAFGAPGCTLRASTEWLTALVLTGGVGSMVWALPPSPSLAGFPCYAQAAVLEASANPLGLILSNSLDCVVGSY